MILEESSPIVTVAPTSDDESKAMVQEFLDVSQSSSGSKVVEKMSLLTRVEVPESVSAEFKGTFQGMVQAGICWIARRNANIAPASKAELLKLYFPSEDNTSVSSSEKILLETSSQAIAFLKERLPTKYKQFDEWEAVEQIMLVWACNSFEGGRIYQGISRVNHSCNPNAIIQAEGGVQRVVAATSIEAGDEITISYLGLLLYAETSVRKHKLETSKFFECQCQRCQQQEDDVAAKVPCPTCHPRELPHQSLDEETQYDDDNSVQYATLGSECEKCKLKVTDKKLVVVMTNVTNKVVSYLASHDGQQHNRGPKRKNTDDDDDEAFEELLGLASTIMGDRHWTTNVLKLLHLDRRLSLMSQAMLTTQELPDLEDIAECIDSLQRIEKYFQAINLDLDVGHVLGDVVIGVSRTLVSLGDEKSQKYAAEWLKKIDGYVATFESEGRQKVVSALAEAWKRHQNTDSKPAAKKAKL